MRVDKTAERQMLKHSMRACGVSDARACVKKFGKKFRIDFSPIFDELAVMQVG
jgi:hypothetical protein